MVNKNLPKHEQRINRKEEKALLKPTWPMLLTLRQVTREGKSLQVTSFFSASVGRLLFASFQQNFELRIAKIENSFKAGQVFQASFNS